MIKNLNLSRFIEVILLIPTAFAIITTMTPEKPVGAWLLAILFCAICLCIIGWRGVNAEIVKACCSVAISIILLINLSSNQIFLDAFALIFQSIFSALTIKNLIVNY